MYKQLLITGGEGFVGRNAMRLFGEGAESFDIKSGLDINDTTALNQAMAGKEMVLHLAAKISVPESHQKPELYHRVNTQGTEQVVKAAIKAGCKALLFFSSAAAKDPSDSPYGRSKYEAEQLLQKYKDQIHITIFRPENIYGPGQNPEYAGVITTFFQHAIKGEPLPITGTGEQTRDFIWVGDIVAIAKKVLENTEHIPSGSIFEVGIGTATSVNQLAEYFVKKYGVKVAHNLEAKTGLTHSKAHNAPLLKAIGGYAFTQFEDGLDRIAQSFLLREDSN